MTTAVQDPLIGQLLDERYLVRSLVARGGMGTVYAGHDTRLDRTVAIKVMHRHLVDDPSFTARFIREARSAARLSHPNVVQVFDQGNQGEMLYLAMEYVPGRTLREVLGERGPLTVGQTLSVLEPMLAALAAAHRAHIVHRDVKPENVLLADDGQVKVADFGLAGANTGAPTASSMLIGTVAYLAPEFVSRGIADPRSDVYAAGIVAFEMLTGQRPFDGDVPIQVAYRHVHEQVPRVSTLVPGLPAELDDVIAAATRRIPDQRPDDAGALLDLVLAVHEEISARADAGEVMATSATGAGTVTGTPPGPGEQPAAGAAGADAVAATGPTTVAVVPARPAVSADPEDEDWQPTQAMTRPRTGRGTQARSRRWTLSRLPLPDLGPRGRRAALAAAVTLAVLICAGLFWFLGPGAGTATPNLVGHDVQEAAATLTRQGLRSRQVPVFDSRAGLGEVVATSPAPGARVARHGVVTLRVASFALVPQLVGVKQTEAEAQLRAASLTAGEARSSYSDRPKGEVLSTDPAPGARAPMSSTVVLTVSRGPRPVTVPTVVTRTRDDALAALDKLGLRARFAPDQFSDTVAAGAVISQSAAPGSKLVPGSTVELVLSKGPALVGVPDLVNRPYGDAERVLRGLGLQAARNNVLGGVFGTVRAQNPPPGTQVPRGTTVTLNVV